LDLKFKYDSGKVSIFVGNDLAKHGNWFQTFREFALVAYSSKEYAIRFQMSILQDTVSKRREQITQWRDVSIPEGRVYRLHRSDKL